MVLVLWFMLWVEWENAKAPHRAKAKEEMTNVKSIMFIFVSMLVLVWPKQIMRADETRLLVVVQFCNHHGLVLSMHEMPSWLSLFVLCSVESLGCLDGCKV